MMKAIEQKTRADDYRGRMLQRRGETSNIQTTDGNIFRPNLINPWLLLR